MAAFSIDDKLPSPMNYRTIRLLCLISAMIVVVFAYNVAHDPSMIRSYSVGSCIVGIGFAIWCAASTTRTRLVAKRKFVWFTVASTGFVMCLDCIFTLEHKKHIQAEAGHEGIFAAVFYPPVQIAMLVMSLALAWSMVSLMAIVESSEQSI